jgi:hypothetical protein
MKGLSTRNKKKEFYGKRIITYNGEPVLSTEINCVDNQTELIKVICTCGRIVQHIGWKLHILRPLCIEYHLVTGETPDWKPI